MLLSDVKACAMLFALGGACVGTARADMNPTEPKDMFVPDQTALPVVDRDMLASYGGFHIAAGGRIFDGTTFKSGHYASVGADHAQHLEPQRGVSDCARTDLADPDWRGRFDAGDVPADR